MVGSAASRSRGSCTVRFMDKKFRIVCGQPFLAAGETSPEGEGTVTYTSPGKGEYRNAWRRESLRGRRRATEQTNTAPTPMLPGCFSALLICRGAKDAHSPIAARSPPHTPRTPGGRRNDLAAAPLFFPSESQIAAALPMLPRKAGGGPPPATTRCLGAHALCSASTADAALLEDLPPSGPGGQR